MSASQGTNAPRSDSVAILGSGVAGLITAYTLIHDGYTNVKILTRDLRVGGIWATNRVYPGLHLNNVHGEYRLSPLEMPPPSSADGRLSGDDMAQYMVRFTDKYLSDRVEFGLDISNIRRGSNGEGWLLDVRDVQTGKQETRPFSRLVVCTGGCDSPKLPMKLSPDAARAAGFKGLVFHSVDFGPKLQDLIASVPPCDPSETSKSLGSSVVVIGGGKSAQDIAAYLANEGRAVTMICPDLDAFTAGPKPLPDFIRKSRLLSLFSPHIHLRTSLERFLHTTRVGQKTVDFMWNGLVDSSFKAANIPTDSPLRNTVSPFWHVRINDEGIPRENGFHGLAVAGKIDVITPAHAVGFSEDGQSVTLDSGRSIRASAVVLATGYQSSWSSLFEANAAEELGLNPHPAAETSSDHHWDYTSLYNPPPLHPDAKKWSSSIYRGIVPSRNIARRDFAVNGACVSPNNGYTLEVASHWISSYFLGDEMRLPETPEAALAETDRAAAWLRTRYPEVPTALNSSHTGYLAFWTWPQHVDDLLEDMGLAVMRSGGNGLTWPFKVIDLKEIAHLKEERDAKRSTRDAQQQQA
ncbi:FAD/NAD-P-binding domain-containing protein [Trametes versicolor FP-101664 SS1]|uniref:FAD/NAD-P-binding domain-containing protein n=1 Tax=Trametes versicolor (strain FP-101664) TaxID=717944 RepID=UPI0004623A61|nr:FAD/NAD-P-binding domain-containing protein [Trametes versicolor FP-101664 SS1]EIW61544.1 FAD/NAD-P-binding domain-containing protein [Trametes versicolor FP-101664 SS1]